MDQDVISIRPFLGARDFNLSRQFYTEFGINEDIIDERMSVFKRGNFAFYLQDYYTAEWIDNTMVFLEVPDPAFWHGHILSLGIISKYAGVRLSEVLHFDWGSECFLHDPSGILWHIGSFREGPSSRS